MRVPGEPRANLPPERTIYFIAGVTLDDGNPEDRAEIQRRLGRLAEAERLLQLIADNSLVDDACWTARSYFKDYDFADLQSAPQWFKEAAEQAKP